MALTISPEAPPLSVDADGVVRVAHTRVTLDSVVSAFREGATPEEIAQQFSTLRLTDLYAAISYYLRHQDAVERYLRERQELSARVREENEARWQPVGIRERLLARRPTPPNAPA